MTVIYDAKNHVSIIFSLHGSVWPSVWPWCAWNVAVTVGIWLLNKYDIANVTFEGGLGYGYISTLVSFFLVLNTNTAYSRFWEARLHLGHAYHQLSSLALRTATFSAKQTDEKANMWRKSMKVRMLNLLDCCMYGVQEERGATLNVMKEALEGGFAIDVNSDNIRHQSLLNQVSATGGLGKHDTPPMFHVLKLEAAILANKEYLDPPLPIQHQMDLLGAVKAFYASYHELLKFSSTPRPYPIVQMGHTLVILFVLSLPLALSQVQGIEESEAQGLAVSIFLVFLVTFGYIGMMEAEIEMHDPLGSDVNDIETDRYTKLVHVYVEDVLGNDDYQKWILHNFDLSHAAGYGSIPTPSATGS